MIQLYISIILHKSIILNLKRINLQISKKHFCVFFQLITYFFRSLGWHYSCKVVRVKIRNLKLIRFGISIFFWLLTQRRLHSWYNHLFIFQSIWLDSWKYSSCSEIFHTLLMNIVLFRDRCTFNSTWTSLYFWLSYMLHIVLLIFYLTLKFWALNSISLFFIFSAWGIF